MEDNDAMQRKLRFIKDDLMNKTLGELLNMLKDAAASGNEASAQSAKYLEYMLSCGVVRSSDPANSVHISGLDELVQVLAMYRLATVPSVERPANGFPVQMALSDLGPELPEHAAVRKAVSSNADEDTVKKAKAALVDRILARAETHRPSYVPSDFNADDPMSFIRYLMKKVSFLESRCSLLEKRMEAADKALDGLRALQLTVDRMLDNCRYNHASPQEKARIDRERAADFEMCTMRPHDD